MSWWCEVVGSRAGGEVVGSRAGGVIWWRLELVV